MLTFAAIACAGIVEDTAVPNAGHESIPTTSPIATQVLLPTPWILKMQEGRRLRLEVHSLERTPELRFHWCPYDDNSGELDCSRQENRIIIAEPENELVVVKATIWGISPVSTQPRDAAAELRDVTNVAYRSLAAWETAWHDFRGSPYALFRADSGSCNDGVRILVEEGTPISWWNEIRGDQYIYFEDGIHPIVPEQGKWIREARWIHEGGSRIYVYEKPGEHKYRLLCGEGRSTWDAVLIRVIKHADAAAAFLDQGYAPFLESSRVWHRYLQPNSGYTGFLVFEAPEGIELQDIRWRAGEYTMIDLQPSARIPIFLNSNRLPGHRSVSDNVEHPMAADGQFEALEPCT